MRILNDRLNIKKSHWKKVKKNEESKEANRDNYYEKEKNPKKGFEFLENDDENKGSNVDMKF